MLNNVMSIVSKIAYLRKKYQLRNIAALPVHHLIFSENSSDHWQHLEVNNRNVLDLGIGRWGTADLEETSPIYFKNCGAQQIIGVDGNAEEVKFFDQYFKNTFHDRSSFIHRYVNKPEDISKLIQAHDINAIKCDIEGAEIYLFRIKLNAYPTIEEVAIEYHSPFLLKQLIAVNTKEWHFIVKDHSIFSENPHMGVVTLSRKAAITERRLPI